jgi:hypothetical protein
MRIRILLLFCLFFGWLWSTACFAQTPASAATNQQPHPTAQVHQNAQDHPTAQGPAYSLPPAKLKRAEALNRDENWLWAIGTVWGLVYLLLFLRLRASHPVRGCRGSSFCLC